MEPLIRREAWVVVDLGFGDAGKGATVDYLVRERGAVGVVRFSGGAQAGHRVVTPDGRSHVFSQFGAGSFVEGVRTHLSSQVITHPLAMLFEADALARVGVRDALDRLTVSPDALVITPYHQAAGRLRELARGDRAHGTCGVGVGEAVRDALAYPDDALRFGDLWSKTQVKQRLTRIQERLTVSIQGAHTTHPAAADERALMEDVEVAARWLEALTPLTARTSLVDGGGLSRLLNAGPVVFEGSQGVLLDEWRGFHPHTTWSTCTTANADALLAERGYDGGVTRLGVLRSYGVRHGPGPFPAEDPGWSMLREAANDDLGWQGRFRRGGFDAALARYALAVCPVDGLALTHLDRRGPQRAVAGYRGGDPQPGPAGDLTYQAALGASLDAAELIWAAVPEDFVGWVEAALEAPVLLEARGPSAADRRWRHLSG